MNAAICSKCGLPLSPADCDVYWENGENPHSVTVECGPCGNSEAPAEWGYPPSDRRGTNRDRQRG